MGQKVYQDLGFLETDECRPVRLQLEYMRPEHEMRERGIESIVVVFGSARVPEPEAAKAARDAARAALEAKPSDGELEAALKISQQRLELSAYYDEAREFGRLATAYSLKDPKREFVVATGGGPGFMEAANRGALDSGGLSIGFNITLPHEQHPNPYLSPGLGFEFRYFSMRKMHFMQRAKALVAFPGGFGTFDELFEALTLIQTGKVRKMPVALVGAEFWKNIVDWNRFADWGLIRPADLELIKICDTAVEAWEQVLGFWESNGF
jgi:uncharacterized protein (TIGR00730 family)